MTEVKQATCKNKRQTERFCKHKVRFQYCQGCELHYYWESAGDPDSDFSMCNSPIPIKYGDTIEITIDCHLIGEEE